MPLINLSNIKKKILGNVKNQTWGCWVRSKYASPFEREALQDIERPFPKAGFEPSTVWFPRPSSGTQAEQNCCLMLLGEKEEMKEDELIRRKVLISVSRFGSPTVSGHNGQEKSGMQISRHSNHNGHLTGIKFFSNGCRAKMDTLVVVGAMKLSEIGPEWHSNGKLRWCNCGWRCP